MAELRLKINGTFRKNWNSTKRIVINRGGTRAGKTYSLCQLAANWLITGQVRANKELKKGTWSIVRKYRATISRTVEREFIDVCQNIFLGDKPIFDLLKINKSDKTYRYKDLMTKDVRVVCFIGADDPQKLRGYKSNILFCNEANELQFDKEFFQLRMRTTDEIFLDFNPSDEYIWINSELEQKRLHTKKDVEIVISTYKDNPTLNFEQVSEIEDLQNTDLELWKVYGLGEYGKIQGLIFDNWTTCETMPKNPKWRVYGLDFGYTNDPTALVEIALYRGELYINELIYEKRLTNTDLSKRFNEIKISGRVEIIADSADPKSIEELRRAGFFILPCKKGSDSIKFGIDVMKRYKINIVATAVNVLKEFRTYKYKPSRTGEGNTNEPIDFNNHSIDAVRYAITHKVIIPNQESQVYDF